jgi:hypothetical protein
MVEGGWKWLRLLFLLQYLGAGDISNASDREVDLAEVHVPE